MRRKPIFKFLDQNLLDFDVVLRHQVPHLFLPLDLHIFRIPHCLKINNLNDLKSLKFATKSIRIVTFPASKTRARAYSKYSNTLSWSFSHIFFSSSNPVWWVNSYLRQNARKSVTEIQTFVLSTPIAPEETLDGVRNERKNDFLCCFIYLINVYITLRVCLCSPDYKT